MMKFGSFGRECLEIGKEGLRFFCRRLCRLLEIVSGWRTGC